MSNFHSAMGQFVFEADGALLSLETLRHNGDGIDASTRKDLIERSRAGEHIEIEFEAITYIQRDTPNRNFIRFRQGALRKIASSGKSSVFLRDHAQRLQSARGGTIVKSKLEKDGEGNALFKQTIRLTKDWAVQGALDGTIDRFSIGWSPTGPVTYRHSGEELERWPKHWPGDKLEDGSRVEWVFMDAELIETSGVNVPAVLGTQIEGIREALSLALGKSPGENPSAQELNSGTPPHGETRMNGIKSILGLSASASEQDITAAVGKLQADLAVATAKAKEATDELGVLQAKIEVERATQLEATVEREIESAIADGRLKLCRDSDGNRVPSQVEVAIRNLGTKLGAAALQEQLKSLPKLHGAPIASQSVGTEPSQDPPAVGGTEAKTVLSRNPHLAGMLAQQGLTEEDLEKYGALDGVPPSILRSN